MKAIIKHAAKEVYEQELEQFVFGHPAQVALLGLQFQWTADTQASAGIHCFSCMEANAGKTHPSPSNAKRTGNCSRCQQPLPNCQCAGCAVCVQDRQDRDDQGAEEG